MHHGFLSEGSVCLRGVMKCCLLPSVDLSVFIVAECCVFNTLWGYKRGVGPGGNVYCYKGILSFHLLLPFEKRGSV